TLQDGLHATRNLVMLFADDLGVEDAGRGIERIHGGIDAQLGQLPRQDRGGVQVRKGGRRRGIGEVVRRHINRLNRRNRTALRRGNPFLKSAHLRRQVRLIPFGGRHASQEGRHFGARLSKSKDVVDK